MDPTRPVHPGEWDRVSAGMAPVYQPTGERFAATAQEREKQALPGFIYPLMGGIGQNDPDGQRMSRRSALFGPPPADDGCDARRAAVADLYFKLLENAQTLTTLASMWQPDRDRKIDRRDLIRGLSQLELELSAAEVEILCEISGVGAKDVRGVSTLIDVRELVAACNRVGLTLPTKDTNGRIDALTRLLSARVARKRPGRSALEDIRTERASPSPRGCRALGHWQLPSTAAGQPVSEQLRQALIEQTARVVDLFREWDTNGDGLITLDEFTGGIRKLGYAADDASIAALFRSWDVDGSGAISLRELNSILRRGGTVTLAAHLRFDPEVSTKRKAEAVRKKAAAAAKTVKGALAGRVRPGDHGAGPAAMDAQGETLLKRLAKNKEQLQELIRSWDKNKDGYISRKEFRQAVPLTCGAAPHNLDVLFDVMDYAGKGRIPVGHLYSCLRWASHAKAGTITNLIGRLDFDEQLPPLEALKDALAANAVRVQDLFRAFDEDASGFIDADEFRFGLRMLGISVADETSDALYRYFDHDGSGSICLKEFNKALRREAKNKAESSRRKKAEQGQEELVSLDRLKLEMKAEYARLRVSV